jgi:hypothetical protein
MSSIGARRSAAGAGRPSFFVLGVVFLGLGFNETGASGSCLPLCMEAPHRVCCFLYLFFMFSPIFSCVLGC